MDFNYKTSKHIYIFCKLIPSWNLAICQFLNHKITVGYLFTDAEVYEIYL